MTEYFESYEDYLRSEQWRDKRDAVLIRDKGRCSVKNCQRRHLHVHHMFYPEYDEMGIEPIEWLVTLCDIHHRAVHQHDPKLQSLSLEQRTRLIIDTALPLGTNAREFSRGDAKSKSYPRSRDGIVEKLRELSARFAAFEKTKPANR